MPYQLSPYIRQRVLDLAGPAREGKLPNSVILNDTFGYRFCIWFQRVLMIVIFKAIQLVRICKPR